MKKSLRFLMFGGFLGAGKTTAIRKYVGWLFSAKGLRSAVITNDQAAGLVDSELMEDSGIDTGEIAGGCFCCRSDLLMETADRIVNDFNPDVIVAEPVGSCTDLVATVSLPISVVFQKPFEVGPLTVLLDPLRAERVLKRAAAGVTDPNDVDYIYLKQLEEAQVIVVNKKELLSAVRLAALEAALKQRYVRATVFVVSVRKGEGLEAWWEYLHATKAVTPSIMEVDYARYAEGEAKMGWVNAGYWASSDADLDFNSAAQQIMDDVVNGFRESGIEVAHFKFRITSDDGGAATVVQWVDNEQQPEFTSRTEGLRKEGRIVVNLRAESEPQQLGEIVHGAVSRAFAGCVLMQESIAAFSPGAPNPVHRVSEVPVG